MLGLGVEGGESWGADLSEGCAENSGEIWEWRPRPALAWPGRLRAQSLFLVPPPVNSNTAAAREPKIGLALPRREGIRVNPGLSMAAALVEKRPGPGVPGWLRKVWDS